MLTLLHALQDEGADHWRVVAQAWGVEYPASARDPLSDLILTILDPGRVAERYRELPPEARAALAALRRAGGKIPVAEFFYRYGEIRSMGAARRQREQPWVNPVSVSERLWYSGWLGRAFIRAGSDVQEYLFLPGDLEALIPAGAEDTASYANLLSYQPARHELISRAESRAAEDACTILAYVRNWPQPERHPIERWNPSQPLLLHGREKPGIALLTHLLKEQGMIRGDPLAPDPELARAFLERGAEDATCVLLRGWRDSPEWNDLEHMGGLVSEDGWPNDPLRARRKFLEAVRGFPRGEWITIDSALEAIRFTHLEFLRPASEFDVWPLRNKSGEFLRGIESWDRVEGALARYYLAGPLAWLGAVERAPAVDSKAFRLTSLAEALWDEEKPSGKSAEIRARIRPEGSILVMPGTPLLLRYQLARCTDWLGLKAGAYRYGFSPRALERARGQGVRSAHILPLLENLVGNVPAGLAGAIRRWERQGAEVSLRSEQVLIARSADATKKIAALAERDRSVITRLDGPVYLVSHPGSKTLRIRLIDEEILLEEDEQT
ncbi:MAG: hypothetical protein ABSA10_04280 [Anaerolineales bacterium]